MQEQGGGGSGQSLLEKGEHLFFPKISLKFKKSSLSAEPSPLGSVGCLGGNTGPILLRGHAEHHPAVFN